MTTIKKAARWGAAIAATGLAFSLVACSGGGSSDSGSGSSGLTLMIGSSGDAETKAVTDAVDAWATDNNTSVEVVAASDLTQQLGQGFSGGNPPDLFYMSWDQFQTYASNGYLEPYAKDASNADAFYPALKDAFTFDDTFYCEPKDFSTLGLVINTDLWAAAGLTDADIPTDWASLEAAATKLTTGNVTGLVTNGEYARLGVFMNQAGGQLVSDDGKTVTADSAENVAGLTEVKKLLSAGTLKFAKDVSAGWGGEAFGKGLAAMTIEGPWIDGAMKSDYPDVKYKTVELPAGPGGKSTFTFSNCWGIPADSANAAETEKLVSYLTSDEQQAAFAAAFGVIPSTETAAAQYATDYPEKAAFVTGNDYAVSPVAFAGAATVITDFNAAIEGLSSGDPATILGDLQTNLQSALDESK